ncbi:MAG: glycosyltransferase [bacterium]|nr:glycosyltransferase [bacterium]
MRSNGTQTAAEPPAVSVIIPTHDAAGTIGACLDSVLAAGGAGVEVIVADDASTDRTVEIASSRPVRILRSRVNRGSAAARNEAARAARGGILVFIDADVLIPPGALERIRRRIADGPWDGVVGMLGREAAYPNLASFYKNAYMHYTYSLLPHEMGVFYTSIAAITAGAFFAAGGFDERYRRATIEDTDFGVRARARGSRFLLDKGILVRHLRHYSLAGLLRTGFLRTSGVVKIILRSAAGRGGRKTYLTSPRQFTGGIALSLGACLLLAAAPLAGTPALLGALILVLLALLLNRGFLGFILREGGVRRWAQSVPLMIADQVAHGLGAVHGVVTFALGRRY